MNLTEPLRQVGIESRDKWNARRAAEPGRSDSGDGQAEHESKRRGHPAETRARGHVTDRLNDSLKHADLIFSDRDEQGQRRAKVECAGENATPRNRSRKGLSRVFNFITHDRSKLQPDKAEANHAKRVQNKARIRGNAEIRGGHGSSEAEPDNDSEGNQKTSGKERAKAADIVDPLAHAKPDDVEDNKNYEERERSCKGEGFTIGEPRVSWAKNEDGNANEVQHDGGNVHHVVGPVAPTGKKTMEVAKDFLGPEVDAAFAGIAVCKLDNRDSLRPEKEKQRNHPKPDGDAAVGGDGGNYVQVEDSDNKEQNEVPAAKDTLQMRRSRRLHCRERSGDDLVWQLLSPTTLPQWNQLAH